MTCTTSADCNDIDACTEDTCQSADGAALEFDGTNDYVNLGNDGNAAEVNYLTNFGTGSFTVVRTVEIEGLDLQADGGTHVANTREVGSVRVAGYKSKGRINKRIELALD